MNDPGKSSMLPPAGREGLAADGRALVVVLLAAILVRAALMLAGPWPFDDPDNYLPLARSLIQGQGLSLNGRPTAYRPPLYPMILAPILKILGAQVNWGIAFSTWPWARRRSA